MGERGPYGDRLPHAGSASVRASRRVLIGAAVIVLLALGVPELWLLVRVARHAPGAIFSSLALRPLVTIVLVVVGVALWRRRRANSAAGRGEPARIPVQDTATPWLGRMLISPLRKTGIPWPYLLLAGTIAWAVIIFGGMQLRMYAAGRSIAAYDPEMAAQMPSGTQLLGGFLPVAILGVACVAMYVVGGRLAARKRWSDLSNIGDPLIAPSVTEALNRASIAAGVKAPVTRVVQQAGINAAIVDSVAATPRIIVTAGAIRELSAADLEVVFANLLARLKMGVAGSDAQSDKLTEAAGPVDLSEINASADAETLLMLRDPERVLATMHKIARTGHRMSVGVSLSPACFYCWPKDPPPLDMPERVRQTVAAAGAAGQMWWRETQEKRRLHAEEAAALG